MPVAVLFGLLLLICTNALAAYDYGDPSAAEQAHLEAINRARADPHGEAARLGLSSVFEGTESGAISGQVMPPLTMSSRLSAAALGHSKDMAAQDYFSHYSLDGRDPFERMQDSGYEYRAAGENIATVYSSYAVSATDASLQMYDNLFIDADYPNRGHRVNILSGNYREAGIGVALGQSDYGGYHYNYAWYVTENFGASWENDQPFLLGVVYADNNHDGQYTAGEGLSSVRVKISETGSETLTASAGGYGLPMEAGSYTVVFTATDGSQVSRQVTIADDNVKVDVTADQFSGGNSEVPTLQISVTGSLVVIERNSVSWADSYLLYYAPPDSSGQPDLSQLGTIVMTSERLSVILWPGAHYFTALQALASDGRQVFSSIHETLVP